MEFDTERVRRNAQLATTEDLLDRVTVFRAGLEPAAVEIIENELQRRALGPEAIAAHRAQRSGQVLLDTDGMARRCSFCDRPAVVRQWGWQRLWGVLPTFPRRFFCCERHRSPVSDAAEKRSTRKRR